MSGTKKNGELLAIADGQWDVLFLSFHALPMRLIEETSANQGSAPTSVGRKSIHW